MNEILTNGTEIKQRIITEIQKAEKNIFLAMAFFTDRDIAKAFIEAKNRGVFVDVILSSNANNEEVKGMFITSNISIHAFETGDERGMMHHKFCLIDNSITINGSYNYSFNASKNNVENIQISNDLKIYEQFFKEFERLKHNIEHQININANTETIMKDIETIKVIKTTFYDKLKNIIYAITDINTEKYEQKGFESAKNNEGNIEIFKSNYEQIQQNIKAYSTDDGLGSKKNEMLSNIKSIFENENDDINSKKEQEIISVNEENEIELRQVEEKISAKKEEKITCESGNKNTGEKGLLQINNEIEKTNLEINELDKSFIIRKFWNVGTTFAVIGFVGFLIPYFIVYFSSAIYKMMLEGKIIKSALQAGLMPKDTGLIYPNALIDIYSNEGTIYAMFVVLISLIVMSIIICVNLVKQKWLRYTITIVLSLFIDVFVAIKVTLVQHELSCIIKGIKPTMTMLEALKEGDFYMMLIFGLIPLMFLHFIGNVMIKSYKSSNPEIVNIEKHNQKMILKKSLKDLETQKDLLSQKIEQANNFIKEQFENKNILETKLFENKKNIERKYNEKIKDIKDIYQDFETKITSGKIFTDEISNNVISAYKKGFIDYLPQFYADEIVEKKVKEIEQIIQK